MVQKNALMEWVEQTKRVSKATDYICLSTIDSIITSLHLVDYCLLKEHADFFNEFCNKYHKPNPLHLKKVDMKDTEPSYSDSRDVLNAYVESSIVRCKEAMREVVWQWHEIIDFLFEKPELVNSALIDAYITEQINQVCEAHNKSNPLKSGLRKRFGKYWKDESGKWHPERRART